ncbi:rhodanese-like domain-containing protein [Pseudarthrobacter sp. P1]|uniref:rhodanese-like domain-containing protein n=1 Tax=Pseudarthrobacter sp. P1 TaxID=3418418 RepID=UPI003CE9952F
MRAVARASVPEVGYRTSEYITAGRPTVHDGGQTMQEMTREELLARAAAGTVTVLDVRPTEEFTAAHIPGALSIPLELLEPRLGEVPAGRDIVAYCRSAYCVLAYEAVDLLRANGHEDRRLHEGILEWRLPPRGVQHSAGKRPGDAAAAGIGDGCAGLRPAGVWTGRPCACSAVAAMTEARTSWSTPAKA